MKTIRFFAMSIVTLLVISSCSENLSLLDDDINQDALLKASEISMAVWPMDDGCGLEVYNLFGGQTMDLGTVTVKTFDGSLYVKYEVIEGYSITETHIYAGDIADMPMGNKSNPKIGHFPYAWEDANGSDVVVMEISLDNLPDCFDLAAHAVIICDDGTCEETGWAKAFDKVFAVKSRMDSPFGATLAWSNDGTEYVNYFPLKDFVGGNIDMVKYPEFDPAVGNVSIELDGDIVRFTVTSNTGLVYFSHLFAGSFEELKSIGIWNHWGYPYQINVEVDDQGNEIGEAEHVFELPASLLNGEASEFGGSAWGWYIPMYCIGDC